MGTIDMKETCKKYGFQKDYLALLIRKGRIRGEVDYYGKSYRFLSYKKVNEEDIICYLNRKKRINFNPYELISDEKFECNLKSMLLYNLREEKEGDQNDNR